MIFERTTKFIVERKKFVFLTQTVPKCLKLTPLIFLNFNYSNFNDEFTNTFDTHAPIKISKFRGNTKLRKQNVTNRNYEKIKGLPVLRLRNYQRKTMETDKIF